MLLFPFSELSYSHMPHAKQLHGAIGVCAVCVWQCAGKGGGGGGGGRGEREREGGGEIGFPIDTNYCH